MSILLKITTNVIKRRVANGENIDEVLLQYPRLTAGEIEMIKNEIGG